MTVSIKDVAKRAGVSPATVSRVFNHRERVRPGIAARVLQAAHELGYTPTMAGRSLASGRTGNIGFLIHYRQSIAPGAFYGTLLAGVEQEARRYDLHVVFSRDSQTVPPAMVQERRVDGLILAGCDIPPASIYRLKTDGFPLVLVDNHLPKVDSIATDNIQGAYEAVNHLLQLGHREIAFIAESMENLSFRERFQGYQSALQSAGLPTRDDLVAAGTARELRGPEAGYTLMREVLKRGRPTAVFAANDSVAIGAMRTLKEAGLRIPEDMAVVGFDDDILAAHADPPLTTMRVHRLEMGELAVRRLVELMENSHQPVLCLRIEAQLVVRRSCGSKKR